MLGFFTCKLIKVKIMKNYFMLMIIYKRKTKEEYFLVFRKISQCIDEKEFHLIKEISIDEALNILTHKFPLIMVVLKSKKYFKFHEFF